MVPIDMNNCPKDEKHIVSVFENQWIFARMKKWIKQI